MGSSRVKVVGLVVAAFAVTALAIALLGYAGARRETRPLGGRGLAGLPPAARGPVTAALGAVDPAFRIAGLRASNPAQRLSATFSTGGVSVASGDGRFALSLLAFGRPGALARAPVVSPIAYGGNRVAYGFGSLREWFANGPLGIEQGFDVPRAFTGGSGPVTFALGVSGDLTPRLQNGAVELSGAGGVDLRYTGLLATDARGRTLRSWLALSRGRLLVHVDDRGAIYPLHVDPFIQQAKLTLSDGGSGDDLGWQVAVSGNTLFVGALRQTVGTTTQEGAVWVFVKPSTGWANSTKPNAELTASDGATGDQFGEFVAASGNTVVVGSPYHTVSGHGNSGAAYVYVMPTTGWAGTLTQNAELTASDGSAYKFFGGSVAIAGNTIVVGAPTTVNIPGPGAVYVFAMPSTGWAGTLTQTQELIPGDVGCSNGCDDFGSSVAITVSTLAAGAGGSSSQHPSRVYVYSRTPSGAVIPTGYAELSDDEWYDGVGFSLAISGNTIIAGAPGYLLAGASHTQGAIDVFVKPPGPWVSTSLPAARLLASDAGADDELGYNVAASSNEIVAGAPGKSYNNSTGYQQGAAYVFVRPACGWVSTSAFTAELSSPDVNSQGNALGKGVALWGNTVFAGAPGGAGVSAKLSSAYVFGPAAGSALPLISGLSPASGVAGNTTVLINGTNLGSASAVCIGSQRMKVISDSSTQIKAAVPNGASSSQISVHTPAGTATSPGTFSVTLSVTRLLPATGPAGTRVAISGVGFTAGSTVSFNGTPATVVTRKLPSYLVVVVPAGSTTGPVTVTNTTAPTGTTSSASSFTITAHNPPTISSFTPTTGITGSPVTINGNYFTAATSVTFGARQAKFTVVSATNIQATVPDGDTPSKITVTTPVGSVTSTANFTPTFSITSFSPTSGPPGTKITVNGVGFNTSATVYINGVPALPGTLTPTQLTVTVSPAAITGKITVKQTSAPAGTVESANSFTVN